MTEILNERLFSYGHRLRELGLFGLEKKRLQGDLRATWTSCLVMCMSSWEEHFWSSWRISPFLIAITKLTASRCCTENGSMLLEKRCRILRGFGHVWLTVLQSVPGPDRDQRLSDMTKPFPMLNSFQMRIWQLFWRVQKKNHHESKCHLVQTWQNLTFQPGCPRVPGPPPSGPEC